MAVSSPARSPLRTVGRLLVLAAALFGGICATVLTVSPDKVPAMTQSLYAFASREYRLPDGTSSANPVNEPSVTALKAFSKVFVNISKQTRPALVYIESKRITQARNGPSEDLFFGFPFGMPHGRERGVQQGAGSGFIVDLKNGYVLTNNHVVEGMSELRVQTYDNRWFSAKVVGAHKDTDVAVIQLQSFEPQKLKQMTLGDSDAVEVGDWVVALGAPFQLPQTLTMGVVSATGRDNVMGERSSLQDFIQTDAAINPGNSGGPLVNVDGEVVGINTAIYSRTGSYSGIGFAIPAKIARTVAESLINNNGKVIRGYLGVAMGEDTTLAGVPEGTSGVVVTKVYPGTPAEKAGLKIYDVIQTLGDKPIADARDLQLRISFAKPGDSVNLGVLREGKTIAVKVKIGDYDEGSQKMSLNEGSGETSTTQGFGLALQELSAELRKRLQIRARDGVFVAGVDEESEAAAFFRRGDVILEVNRKRVKSPKEVERMISEGTQSGKRVVFLIEREGSNQIVALSGMGR